MSKWGLIGIAAIASTLPLPLLKSYIATKNNSYMLLAMLSNLIVVYTYFIMLQNQKMNIMYPFIKIISIVMVILIGTFFYEENLITKHKIGIVFGIIALYLLAQ
jgi:uncharacterized membrane protein